MPEYELINVKCKIDTAKKIFSIKVDQINIISMDEIPSKNDINFIFSLFLNEKKLAFLTLAAFHRHVNRKHYLSGIKYKLSYFAFFIHTFEFLVRFPITICMICKKS